MTTTLRDKLTRAKGLLEKHSDPALWALAEPLALGAPPELTWIEWTALIHRAQGNRLALSSSKLSVSVERLQTILMSAMEKLGHLSEADHPDIDSYYDSGICPSIGYAALAVRKAAGNYAAPLPRLYDE